MNLYLVQHGDAVDQAADPDRPLSEDGVRDVEAVAEFLARAGLNVPDLWHSGKTRARQTAERLARHVAPAGKVKQKQGLSPNDPVAPLCEELEGRDEDLAVVGHLPYLSKLASRLLTGDKKAQTVAFERGGVVCLARDEEGSWQVRWMVVPSLLRR